MKINQTLYFTGVIGSFAGLVSWALGVWVPVLLRPSPEMTWIVEVADSLLVGLVMVVFCAVLFGKWSGQGVRILPFTLALLAGGAVAGGLVLAWIYAAPARDLPYWAASLLSWLALGAVLGLVLGAIRGGFLPLRLLLSTTGGGLGAALGAALHLLLGELEPFLSHAAGLMLTGLGISLGAAGAVSLFRRAVLRLEGSGAPEVLGFFAGKATEWEILRGDSYTFGNEQAAGKEFIHVPDLEVASRHAVLRERGGSFVLEPHPDNRGPSGEPFYLLSVERNGQTLVPVGGAGTPLADRDLLRIGRTSFRFSLRGGGMIGAGIFLLLLALPVQAQPEVRLAAAERGCLLEAPPGSERPALRFALNLVDGEGRPLEIPVVDPDLMGREPEVRDGDVRLHVLHAGAVATPPERYAILLVDVSGSMLEPAGDGATKFAHALDACRRFADDFVDGVDRIAVVPFASRGVEEGVRRAVFHTSRQALQEEIDRIPIPEPAANTGFFSAVRAAVERLRRIGEERARAGREAQLLLVAMTDGRNDVGNRGDDPGLLAGLQPVAALLDESGIPAITIGFGDPAQLDEDALRRLARPSRANYLPAADPRELLAAFADARDFQVERLSLTFLLAERFRNQLVRPHQFRVKLRLRRDQAAEGSLEWTPPGGRTAPVFECELSDAERKSLTAGDDFEEWLWLYAVALAVAAAGHAYLWFRLPKRIWADQIDADVLRRRALSAVRL